MKFKQFEIWIADLNPRIGTETGKTRPVVILQSNLLNQTNHPSTIICPTTTQTEKDADILRVHLPNGTAGLEKSCDIMMDQIRAIDNSRLLRKLGVLPKSLADKVIENVKIVLDISC